MKIAVILRALLLATMVETDNHLEECCSDRTAPNLITGHILISHSRSCFRDRKGIVEPVRTYERRTFISSSGAVRLRGEVRRREINQIDFIEYKRSVSLKVVIQWNEQGENTDHTSFRVLDGRKVRRNMAVELADVFRQRYCYRNCEYGSSCPRKRETDQ